MVKGPKYSQEEHARLGQQRFERDVLPKLATEDRGKIVAVDIESGAFALSDSTIKAAHPLLDKFPEAQIWFVRVGSAGVHRFGLGRVSSSMITGFVNERPEARVWLTVIRADGNRVKIEAIVDTGFTGYLTLPQKTRLPSCSSSGSGMRMEY